MGLYNFKKRFVPFILDGSKAHTIRALRKHPDKPGDVLHLYTGLRTKYTKLLGRFECTNIENFLMTPDFKVFVNDVELSPDECNALAYRDGFRAKGTDGAFALMLEFWQERDLPFVGKIVHWNPPSAGRRVA